MGYTALYRKFRPNEFEDVKGQDHIVTTLKNQIKAERVGHAYLFCGTRGTGKTTIAKIFAKAVNCEHPVDGSPCNECASCKSIAAGNSMNVVEIDAASNNGVDNIREIREEVSYSPTQGKYRVYIIDEVHMLSIGAFNALLKTLEEPPSYVIFILATTEAHKIPVTILSRCQRYDFKRIGIPVIASRLKELMEEEQIQAEEKALTYIAKAADGSMRDGLSLLDQCIAFYLGETLTYEKVLEVLGAVDTEVFSQMLRNIHQKEISTLLHSLERLILEGRELGQFVLDFTWYLRNLLLVKSSDQIEDVLDVSRESLLLLQEEAQLITMEELMRYIRIFSELSSQIKYSGQKRVLIEITLIKLCKPSMERNLESMLQRIQDLERAVEQGVVVANSALAGMPGAGQTKTKTAEAVQAPVYKKAAPEELKAVKTEWFSICSQVEGLFGFYLKTAELRFDMRDGDNNTLFIVFTNDLASQYARSQERKEEVERLIANQIQREVAVEMLLKQEDSAKTGHLGPITLEEAIHQNINIDIEIED